jgi:hypothetical protein
VGEHFEKRKTKKCDDCDVCAYKIENKANND